MFSIRFAGETSLIAARCSPQEMPDRNPAKKRQSIRRYDFAGFPFSRWPVFRKAFHLLNVECARRR
jgi:hypothetical protein